MRCKKGYWLFLLAATIAHAEDDFFSSIAVDSSALSTSADDKFSYRGYVQLLAKYGVNAPEDGYAFERDTAGLSRMRSDAFLELRGQANETLQWQLSAKAELDWYQWQHGNAEWQLNRERLRLKDAYLDTTFENGTWLRAGHQVLAWGQSEGLAITDILSPVDSRSPGQAELQDLREQIPAMMLSLPLGDSKLSTVLTWRAGHNRYAEADEDFYPYIALKTAGIGVEYLDPSNRAEVALKWEKHFNGGDVTLIAGDVNDNEFSVSAIQTEVLPPRVQLAQQRVTVAGGTVNRVYGSWLLRAELARYWNQPVEIHPQYAWGEQNQWRGMAGVEYSGWDDISINYEINSVYASDELTLEAGSLEATAPHWQIGHVLRFRQTALNERLTNQVWLMALASDATQILRWDLTFDLSDIWEVAVAAIAYHNDDKTSALYAFRKNDTLNAAVTYHF